MPLIVTEAISLSKLAMLNVAPQTYFESFIQYLNCILFRFYEMDQNGVAAVFEEHFILLFFIIFL